MYQRMSGFTLVELLVALFVFSLLSAFAFRAVTVLGDTSQGVEVETSTLAGLQHAVQFLERDIRQLVAVESSDGDADSVGVSFLTMGMTQSGQLLRVRYVVRDHRLFRDSWGAGTSIDDVPLSSIPLLRAVAAIKFSFLGEDGMVLSVAQSQLPQLLKLTITHEKWGDINRSLLVGGWRPPVDFTSLPAEKSGGGSDKPNPPGQMCPGANPC